MCNVRTLKCTKCNDNIRHAQANIISVLCEQCIFLDTLRLCGIHSAKFKCNVFIITLTPTYIIGRDITITFIGLLRL